MEHTLKKGNGLGKKRKKGEEDYARRELGRTEKGTKTEETKENIYQNRNFLLFDSFTKLESWKMLGSEHINFKPFLFIWWAHLSF